MHATSHQQAGVAGLAYTVTERTPILADYGSNLLIFLKAIDC